MGLGFLAPIAIGMGVNALKKLTGGGRGAGSEERGYRDRFRAGVERMGGTYTGMEDRFIGDLEGFDPEQAFAEKTQADLDAHDERFARTYSDRIGAMVGQGRDPRTSGFGLRDAQDTVDEGMRLRHQIKQQNAGELARMRMGVLGMRGDYARGGMDRYMGAVGDRLNTLEGQRLADAASKREMFGGFMNAAATGLGAYYGGRR